MFEMVYFLRKKCRFELLPLPSSLGNYGLVLLQFKRDDIDFILAAFGFLPGANGAVLETLGELLFEIAFQQDA